MSRSPWESSSQLYRCKVLPQFQPMPLGRSRDPFSHPEWLFEVKWDGFRSLAYVHRGGCRLISRNGTQFKSFPSLADSLPAELRCGSAVLDGEIVCLDRQGKSQFRDLLFRRGEPRLYAFDLLGRDGEDLGYVPLIDRKLRLRSVLPETGVRLLYSTTSRRMARGCSGWRANTTWRGSLPSKKVSDTI